MDKMVILVLCAFPLLIKWMACGTGIIKQPESMTVFTGSEAVFTCEASGAAAMGWNVNGTSALDTNFSVRTVGHISNITLQALHKYNSTMVQCIAGVLGGDFTWSENATLLIQGVLAPVSEVSVQNGNDSILLSWNPPFSLDVTGVDPDIWYTVLISNVTDEDNPTAVPCTDCHNLTQPHYTFTTANPSPCHKYSFTVIPQNGVGEGNRSEPVEKYFVNFHDGIITCDTLGAHIPGGVIVNVNVTHTDNSSSIPIGTISGIAAGVVVTLVATLIAAVIIMICVKMGRRRAKKCAPVQPGNIQLGHVPDRLPQQPTTGNPPTLYTTTRNDNVPSPDLSEVPPVLTKENTDESAVAASAPLLLLETPVESLPQPPGNRAAVLERTISSPGDSLSEIVALSAPPLEADPLCDSTAAANLEVQPTEVPEPQVHTPYLAEVNNANLVPPNMKNSDQSPHKGCPNVTPANEQSLMSDSLMMTPHGREYIRQHPYGAVYCVGQRSEEDSQGKVLSSNSLQPTHGYAEEQQISDMVILDPGGESSKDV